MLPLRIISFFERPPPVQPSVAPVERRPDPTTLPRTTPMEPLARPKYDRRVSGDRRQTERRGQEQTAFLDTRTPQGRRRSSGRRAGDHYQAEFRIAISVKA